MYALAIAIQAIVITILLIPIPQGVRYLNIDDAIIYFMSISLGPLSGLLVGCLGGLLSDLALGFIYKLRSFYDNNQGIEKFICRILYKEAS